MLKTASIFTLLIYSTKMKILLLSLIFFSTGQTANGDTHPLSDGILFGFEKCKKLSVDLEVGQLKEEVVSSFDIHCKKTLKDSKELDCIFFDTGSNKKIGQEFFTGGSDLGRGELTGPTGNKIKFLLGKKYASYESKLNEKVCVGIFIFEQDALKKKVSSLESGL